jgi:hypothetical protein
MLFREGDPAARCDVSDSERDKVDGCWRSEIDSRRDMRREESDQRDTGPIESNTAISVQKKPVQTDDPDREDDAAD